MSDNAINANIAKLGPTNCAASRGGAALDVNPAGLAGQKGTEDSVTYLTDFCAAQYGGCLDATFNNYGWRLILSQLGDVDKIENGDSMTRELDFVFGTGFKLSEKILFGISGGVHQKSIDNLNTQFNYIDRMGFSVSPGVILDIRKASFGVVAGNLGTERETSGIRDLKEEKRTLKTSSVVRGAVRVPLKKVSLMWGASYRNNGKVFGSAGLEYNGRSFSLGAGYSSPNAPDGGFTAGLGFNILSKTSTDGLRLDQSLSFLRDTGPTYRATLTFYHLGKGPV